MYILFRIIDKVICCYDGDCVGCDVVWCVFENVLFYFGDGKLLKFVFLFDGEDLDLLV